MSTKSFVVLALWVVAIVLFGLAGFNVIKNDDVNLMALGLTALTGGFIVNTFVT